jgi:hypothetical protein
MIFKMKADTKSNNQIGRERSEDYYVSILEPWKEGDEHPLVRLKRKIQEARDLAQAARAAEVNTTKSE